eukprot:CAMPEP_0198333510 /NCGR_PEP_ID=MMETSP1450-20131203/18992_1 /TAXON_ID=753684 ORGANISM="Madagascaria erythrocladiodes, Strain CCMP3234" /NCGR_SAMPLE_ID=MMETSP1450 /ASSEMBLY_ACC=CAM_ASM_001115 /LENGTH=279 /DNA_ID=CAMNT_0044038035 /DNA_START=70 /DNA_END=909 /DNA_ORIENTATION=-
MAENQEHVGLADLPQVDWQMVDDGLTFYQMVVQGNDRLEPDGEFDANRKILEDLPDPMLDPPDVGDKSTLDAAQGVFEIENQLPHRPASPVPRETRLLSTFSPYSDETSDRALQSIVEMSRTLKTLPGHVNCFSGDRRRRSLETTIALVASSYYLPLSKALESKGLRDDEVRCLPWKKPRWAPNKCLGFRHATVDKRMCPCAVLCHYDFEIYALYRVSRREISLLKNFDPVVRGCSIQSDQRFFSKDDGMGLNLFCSRYHEGRANHENLVAVVRVTAGN